MGGNWGTSQLARFLTKDSKGCAERKWMDYMYNKIKEKGMGQPLKLCFELGWLSYELDNNYQLRLLGGVKWQQNCFDLMGVIGEGNIMID